MFFFLICYLQAAVMALFRGQEHSNFLMTTLTGLYFSAHVFRWRFHQPDQMHSWTFRVRCLIKLQLNTHLRIRKQGNKPCFFSYSFQLEKDITVKSLRRTLWGPTVSIRKVARQRALSLFLCWSVEQNARDTQMTTRVTEGARRERRARVH